MYTACNPKPPAVCPDAADLKRRTNWTDL